MQGFDQERLSVWGESRKYFTLSFPERQGRGRAAPTRPLFHYNSRPIRTLSDAGSAKI